MTRTAQGLLALALVAVCIVSLAPPPVDAVHPGPPQVTSLHTEVEGEAPVVLPEGCGAGDMVPLTGQLHVVSRMRMSGTDGLSGDLYLNLHGVEGIGTSGQRYLGIGAAQYSVESSPGPPNTFIVNFTLRGVGVPPNPFLPANPCTPEDQALPVAITLTFDETGALTEARAKVEPIAR